MGIFSIKLAGAGYVVLNVIRVMNIITLLAVMGAGMVMLVKIINNNSFFFFDAVDHIVTVVICGFLVLTELPIFKGYFSKYWPLFSARSGFVMLGAAMLLVGNNTLANLNKPQASVDKLGLAFWRLVIGSGIVALFMGATNIVASYVFRDRQQHLTARHVRSNGATASQKLENESSTTSIKKTSRRSQIKSLFLTQKHRESLPSYKSQLATSKPGSIDRSNTNGTTHQRPHSPEMSTHQITSPYAMTPGRHKFGQYPVSPSSKYSVDSPGMQRPNSAYHPAHMGRPF